MGFKDSVKKSKYSYVTISVFLKNIALPMVGRQLGVLPRIGGLEVYITFGHLGFQIEAPKTLIFVYHKWPKPNINWWKDKAISNYYRSFGTKWVDYISWQYGYSHRIFGKVNNPWILLHFQIRVQNCEMFLAFNCNFWIRDSWRLDQWFF